MHSSRMALLRAISRHRLPFVVNQWRGTAIGHLRHHRLPRYSALLAELQPYRQDWEHNLELAGLWNDLFDEEPPDGFITLDSCTAEERLVERLYASPLRFPLDLDYMGELAYSAGEYVIGEGYPIMLEGIAPAWGNHGLDAMWDAVSISPLVACRPDLLEAHLEYSDAESEAQAWADAWWREHGRASTPTVKWIDWPEEQVEAALRALPPPMDGLVAGWWALCGSGNPFLDGTGEVSFDYCWCSACIHRLATAYHEIEPELDAWHEYIDWRARHDPDCSAVILALLTLQPADPAAPPKKFSRPLAKVFRDSGS